MPRNIDAASLVEAKSKHTTLFHLIEISGGTATTGGTITREHDGLMAEVDFSTAADLNDWTILEGNWSLTGGRLEATYPTLDRSRIRYDPLVNTFGHVVQHTYSRDVNTPGDPANSSGFPGVVACIDSSQGGIGTEEWVTPLTNVVPRMFQEGTVTCGASFPEYGVTLDQITENTTGMAIMFTEPGYAEMRIFNSLNETLSSTIGFVDDVEAGLWVRWEHCDNGSQIAFEQPVGFDTFTVMENPWILMHGLPPGWSFQVSSPLAGFSPLSSNVASGSGIATIDFRGSAAPFSTLIVKNSSGGTAATFTGGDTYWGDIYSYTPPSTPGQINVTTATEDVDWNSITWQAVGGAVTFDGVTESIDRDAQTVQIQLPSANMAEIADVLLGSNFRGRRCKIWIVYFDETTSSIVGTPYLVWNGFLKSSINFTEA